MTPETPPPAPNPEEFSESSEHLRETAEADASALLAFEALTQMGTPERSASDEAMLAEYHRHATQLDQLA